MVALVMALASILPFFWMLSTSLKVTREIYVMPPIIIPNHFTLLHYIDVFFHSNIPRYFLNSAIVGVSTALIACVVGVAGGYGFTRFRIPFRNGLSILILMSQMLPTAVILIPLYILINRIGLLDTPTALIICYSAFTVPMAVWLLQGFFHGVPIEIEEAARIEGCSRLGVLFRIVVPVMTPGILATGVYAFTMCWNEFLFALIMTRSSNSKTLPIGISEFTLQQMTDWGATAAAAVVVTIPVLIVFLIFSDKFAKGLARGSIKG